MYSNLNNTSEIIFNEDPIFGQQLEQPSYIMNTYASPFNFIFETNEKDADLFSPKAKEASVFSDALNETSAEKGSTCESPKAIATSFSMPQQAVDYNAMVNEVIQISCFNKRGEKKAEEVPSDDDLIRNRRKLQKTEVSFLQKKFDINQEWDKAYINQLALEINLPYYKIYKWNWDMKKKSAKKQTKLGKRMRDVAEPMNTKRVRTQE